MKYQLQEKRKMLPDITVLIVEDDHFISQVYTKWLQLQGANVLCSTDGVDALRDIARQHVDIVLLDLGMPRLNGFKTLKQLRASPETETLPVIVLSNTTIEKDKSEYKELLDFHVCHILRKYETSLDELVISIKRCLQLQE